MAILGSSAAPRGPRRFAAPSVLAGETVPTRSALALLLFLLLQLFAADPTQAGQTPTPTPTSAQQAPAAKAAPAAQTAPAAPSAQAERPSLLSPEAGTGTGGAFAGTTLSRPVLAPEASAAPGPTLVEIVVRGGKTVAPDAIAFYLGVKTGEPYDEEKVRRGFPRLWDSGLFQDLSLEKESVPGGVRLVAVIVELPRVTDLEFRGNKKLTTSQLKDKLKEAKVEIRVGGPLALREVSKAKAALLDSYRAEGFRSAAVDATIEKISESERRVVFLVDEGDKIKIDTILFTGNTVFGQATLRRALKKTHQAYWWKFWDSKDVYSQANYEEDVDSLKKLYQNKGYKDIVVKDPVLDVFVVNPKEKKAENVKRRAKITIPLVEGDRFIAGTLVVEGTTLFDAKKLARVFSDLKPGKPLNRQVLLDGMKSIDALYRERGYIYVFMNPEYTEKPDHVVDVSVKVTEGDQYRVGRVEFSGNKTTKDKVLRRELQLFEGDILDMEAFRKGVFKITQLGYFKIEEDPDFRVNPDKKTVDVTVKGQDTNRNEVQFGAGYSQLDGLFGQFQFSTRNFLGRGDTLSAQFQRGSSSTFYDLSFVEPWFMDERISVGGAIFNRTLNYLDVDQRTRGLNASIGFGLGLFDAVSFFYGFTDTKSRYQVFPAPIPPGGGTPPVAYADYTGVTSAITPGYRFDSRNDPFNPTRGKRYGASVTFAGGLLGGDFSYVKALLDYTWFIPATKKSHFAVNVTAGMLRPYDGRELPIFERFRIGGDRSVRAFEFGAIFPLDEGDHAYFTDQGALLGGDRMTVVNLEYVYYLAGPLNVVFFFDAGNAWIEGQAWNPFDMRTAAGVELRIFLPIFQAPLRFIYGVNLAPKVILQPDGIVLPNGVEKRSTFLFSIGSTF